MNLNEKDQQIKKCKNINFNEGSKYIFWWDPPPYEKYQQIEKCEKINLD